MTAGASGARDGITVPHAATIAGVTIPRMQQLLRTGQVQGWREGRQWKTTRHAVETYLLRRQGLRPEADRPLVGDTYG